MAVELKGPGRFLAVLIGLGLLAYAGVKYGWFDRLRGGRSAGPAGTVAEGRKESPAGVTVDFLYTTEKEQWLKAAVEEFHRQHPEIAVNLKPTGSIESGRSLAAGAAEPPGRAPAAPAAGTLRR